jgi:hypothetical protein
MMHGGPVMQNGYYNPPQPAYGPQLPPQSRIPQRNAGYVAQAGYQSQPPRGPVHAAYPPRHPNRVVQASHVPPAAGPVAHRVQPFAGAGIIQRAAVAAPGAPQHVLVAPGGKILAYLQAGPGVNLEGSIGRSMGVRGNRAHNPQLRMDHIVVQNMTPVRITR